MDIGGSGIQADQAALAVAQRFVADEKPAVLPVVAPDAGFSFLRDAFGQCAPNIPLHVLPVAGMIEPLTPFLRRHAILNRCSEILGRRPVHQKHPAIGTDGPNQVRHRVQEHSQLLLAMMNPRVRVVLEPHDAAGFDERHGRLIGRHLKHQPLRLRWEIGSL